MDISKKLQQLYSLQERVSYADLGSQISDELFFEITNVLGKKKLADLGTLSRKNILGILSTKIRDLQILDQQQYQSWAIGKGMVTRAKDGLDENKRKDLMTSGKFGNYFQLAYSFSYDYITAIDDQYLRKVFIDACVADPDRITDLVKQRFDLVDGPDLIKDFKQKIKTFVPLQYHKNGTEKMQATGRVIFFGGLPGIFVPNRTFFMPEGEATQGEKRKMDACMHLNVFDNLYAAIRSQLYTLDKEEEKTMQHKEYQEIFTQMLDDIINDPGLKQNDIKRQLRDFADAIKHAENFRMMQAKMYHLPKITFSNRYQDRLHMDAIRNRITSTLKDIGLITDYISQQTESMRELLSQQELALKGFHAKTLANATYDSLKGAPFAFAFEDYENQINNIMESFRLKTLVAPFDQFDKQIKSVFGTSSDFNFLSGKKMRIKMFQAEVLCRLQRLVWLSYVIEHDVKMGDLVPSAIPGNFHIEELDLFKSSYSQIYESFFQPIEDIILSFKKDYSLEKTADVQEMKELFQKIRDPLIMDENIAAIASLS